MDHEEQRILAVIDSLPVKPEGVHALVQLSDTDPQPHVLYKNSTYTLLLRPHALFDAASYDLFEVHLLCDEQIIYHEDVFTESAGKASIRDIINEYNTKNLQAA